MEYWVESVRAHIQSHVISRYVATLMDIAAVALTTSGKLNNPNAGVLIAISVKTPWIETYFPLPIILGGM